MRIVGMMVVGGPEGSRYLEASLDEIDRLCDDALIVLNNADDRAKEMVRTRKFRHYEDNREWGIFQPRIKEELVRRLGDLRPDWVVAIDSDEQFDEEVTREVLEKLAGRSKTAWYFRVVNLWNSRSTHVESLSFWNVRFWRYEPKYGLGFGVRNLHCGLAPNWAYFHGSYAPYMLRHYGLMAPESRFRRTERYAKYDPDSKFMDKSYYDVLKTEPKTTETDWKAMREELKKKVPMNYSDKEPRLETPMKYFNVRREDGKVVEIPEKHLQDTLRRNKLWKIVADPTPPPVVMEERKITVVTSSDHKSDAPPEDKSYLQGTEPEPETLVCQCGFRTQNVRGMSIHRGRFKHELMEK